MRIDKDFPPLTPALGKYLHVRRYRSTMPILLVHTSPLDVISLLCPCMILRKVTLVRAEGREHSGTWGQLEGHPDAGYREWRGEPLRLRCCRPLFGDERRHGSRVDAYIRGRYHGNDEHMRD